MDDWLTQDHLARFVVEVIDGLDLSNLTRQYAGRGSEEHDPATLLAILVYGYCTGVFSSHKLETATYGSVAFRYIAAGRHPDHDTLATFRRRFIDELAGLFVQVLEMATELKLREDRLAAMATAKIKIAARAVERYAREKAEFDEKMSKRQAKEKETGKKPRGKTPTAPEPGVKDSDQINLTDEESRIMPVAGGSFEQCYNAQDAVDAPTMLVVAATLTQAPNDKQQVQPMIKVLQDQAPKLGDVEILIADTGYCRVRNIVACDEAKMEPLIAMARQDH